MISLLALDSNGDVVIPSESRSRRLGNRRVRPASNAAVLALADDEQLAALAGAGVVADVLLALLVEGRVVGGQRVQVLEGHAGERRHVDRSAGELVEDQADGSRDGRLLGLSLRDELVDRRLGGGETASAVGGTVLGDERDGDGSHDVLCLSFCPMIGDLILTLTIIF